MRSIKLVFCLLACMAITAVASWFPGTGKTAAEYEAAIAALPESDTLVKYHKAVLKQYAILATTAPAAWTDIVTATTQAVQFSGYTKDATMQLALSYVEGCYKNLGNTPAILIGAKAAAVDYPWYICQFSRHKPLAVSMQLTANDIINAADASIQAKPDTAGIVSVCVTVGCKALPESTLSEAEQIALLKKWNRKISVKLAGEDKAKWEPIVVVIRTILETYK